MKMFPKTSLVLALALGTASAALLAPQPAMAAAKAKAPTLKYSEAVRKPAAAVQEAMKKNDTAAASAALEQARAAAQSNDDRYLIGSLDYDVGRATNNLKQQAAGIKGMLDSGFVPDAQKPSFNFALGQALYLTKDYAGAEQALQTAVSLNITQPEAFAMLADAKNKLGKQGEAVALIQTAADNGLAAGKPIPNDWYGMGINFGSQAKLPDAVTRLTLSWLKAYPTQTHWRDSLSLYRDMRKLDLDTSLDVMRLARTAGALRGERDYVELAEATYLRFPAEAKSVIDSGVSAGVLNLAQMRGAAELSTLANGKIAADKASLSKNVSTAKSAVSTADAYASYGEYDSAIELYRKALTLGGVDAGMVNTRIGAALYAQGKKDEAKTVFASITGPRADLAHYWMTLIDSPPTAD